MRYLKEAGSVVVGVLVLAVNFLFIQRAVPFLFPVLNVVGGIVAAAPAVWIFYSRYRTSKELEQQFIIFIRDVSDSIKSGMSLPMALDHCSKRDYAGLTRHVKRLSAQIEWGIPLKKALTTFGENTNSMAIKRAVITITATYKIGGKISDTLDAVSRSLVTISQISKERSASVYSQIVTSYVIFFVFIFILVILQTFMIPSLTAQAGQGMALMKGMQVISSPDVFTQSFTVFIIIQGFFAGLATGKMAEGSLVAGLKHSMLLIITGYGIFSFAAMLF
jgi:flagellar protein FlaJ